MTPASSRSDGKRGAARWPRVAGFATAGRPGGTRFLTAGQPGVAGFATAEQPGIAGFATTGRVAGFATMGRPGVAVVLGLAAIGIAAAGCGGRKRPPSGDAGVIASAPRDAAPMVIADAAPATPPRSEHVVWELVPNRHLAHRAVDGELVVDASDIGFARFIRFGLPAPRWRLGQVVDGERAAIAERLASLEVPLSHVQTRSTQLTLRIRGAAKQAIVVKLNGRKAGPRAAAARVTLEPGWQTLAVALDPAHLVVGENQLAIETIGGKAPIAIGWLRIGTETPVGDQDPRAALAFDAAGDALELSANAEVAWYVTVPDGANLVADVAPAAPGKRAAGGGAPAGSAPGSPCRVEVAARAGDDSLTGGMLGGAAPRVDLSGAAGKVVRLSLIARDCPRTRIVHPRITLHGPSPGALPAGEPPRYIVLWVMDALRADKIPIFTPGARAKTPSFDALAASSTVFRQYYVQGNESQASHSSFWTSLYPAVHGVRLAGDPKKINSTLSRRFDLLATLLAGAGYFTAASTGNGYVNSDDHYDRGFREFRNLMRESGVENNFIPGEKIVTAALGQLDKHRDGPTYLFLGTIDTHGPWVARKPWIDLYSPGPYRGPFQEFATAKDLGFKPGSMGCGIIPPPADIERLRAIYDSAVSYTDQQLGRVVRQLQAWGIWDQTMLILTSDHGEEMFEDQRCGHGGSLRDSLERVPLLIHDPARFPGGTIVEEGVEGVDLLPTVLAAIGQPPLATAQGDALAPLAQGIGKGWARPSYASMYEYAHAMRIGRWKARVGANGVALIDDLVADPDETQDLAASHPVERRMLTDDLGLFLALRTRWQKRTWGVVTAMTPAGAAALDTASTP